MHNKKSYTLKDYIENPWRLFNTVIRNKWVKKLPDKLYLSLQWRAETGKKLNLKDPKTFNEKLQWLKLYYHRREFSTMVDKAAVKEYVANILGDKYIIPTIGEWSTPDEINFNSLPLKFVLKCTHDSGGLVICKNKAELNIEETIKKLSAALKRDYSKASREWPYKFVPRRIIAEKFMEDACYKELKDYKFFCFNGKPELCQVISDRSTDEKIDFYDMNWNRIEGLLGLNQKAHNSDALFQCPSSFDEMKRCVSTLAKKISCPFVRIDFYEIAGQPYFGEITFFPNSGFGHFKPVEWERKLGDLITLPEPII